MNDDAPGFVISFLTGSCSFPATRTMLRSVFVAVNEGRMALSDSPANARSGRCGHPHSRPLVASRGALLPPSLLALMGRPPKLKG